MRFFKDSRLDIYMTEIQSDLSRVETLISNAADLLFAGFTNTSLLVRVQQKLAVELAAAKESELLAGSRPVQPCALDENEQAAAGQHLTLPLAMAQQAVVADQIEQEVGKIVRALQFQDMTTQLLAHAKGRLAALESTLERIGDGAMPAFPRRDDEIMTAGQGKSSFRPAAVRVEAQIIHFPRSRAVVRQQGLETGDVELF